jgi:hypothetical protein
VHLIDRLMLPKVQPSHQQHHIESKCEVGQRQRIGLRATVRPLVSGAVHIRTAIACVVQLDHPVQRDHRAPGQRHRLMQRPMTREDIHARSVDTSVESPVDNFEGGSSLCSLGLYSLKVIKDRGEVVIEEGADHAEKEESTSQARVKRR